jgi:hypothetical protein
MRERPILFSSEMVRAILDGRKTQTRRVIKPQPIDVDLVEILCGNKVHYRRPTDDPMIEEALKLPEYQVRSVIAGLKENCPYGKPGDRLWVRETWAWRYGKEKYKDQRDIEYKATNEIGSGVIFWKPSIFMPRWASRIMLEIVNVRVERVQDISRNDCILEGLSSKISLNNYGTGSIEKDGYAVLWDSINAKRGYGWDVNPWVWVIEFKKVSE